MWRIVQRKCVTNVISLVQNHVRTFPVRALPVRSTTARLRGRAVVTSLARFSSTAAREQSSQDDESGFHSIIGDGEKPTGQGTRMEFQAETRMLLDIVAKSLYSEKEVFIRELISNSSDALEKVRYFNLTGKSLESPDRALEIHIGTDKVAKTLTVQDTGVGMTREELVDNLGTIARSGSKAFLEELKKGSVDPGTIIGQFGVGFYSTFMIAEKVEVYTRASGSPGYLWTSDGTGTYEVGEAENVQLGTKIVARLKPDSLEFADEDRIKEVIRKYSNFVGNPIFLNGKQVNTIQAVWLMDPKDVSEEMHEEFYRFVGNSYDRPRFTLHYRTDAPVNLRTLLYFPEGKPGLFDLSRDMDVGISLYCRKVLIRHRAENILPKWLRFVKGVVDSEDIPLNLSRELLQDSSQIRKLRTVLTNRVVRFLQDRARKEPDSYREFITNYGIFFKEGILTGQEQMEKEEIARLLQYESSKCPAGERVTLMDYASRMKPGERDIFYLAAPSRHLAESSAYFEAFKARDVEVLFCYEPYDELVLMTLRQFDRKNLTSVEKEMRQEKESVKVEEMEGSLPKSELDALTEWMKDTLGGKVSAVKYTGKLDSHPCVVTVEDMGAARHFVRTQFAGIPEEQRYRLLQPQLDVNPRHPIVKKLAELRTGNPELAALVTEQLFSNAMVSAGLVEDPRTVLTKFNQLLALALEKH
ncbi:unnamed protein product [Darwinula stevensoni]|uniref:Heat shock protein 75 kDa, mitochondrial n=1 Tax=Darwinula stevensoni TaxID=69355 RepID=A0A7R8XCU8_9CRUS|nr:unnamed protein product [Darwinula stevensoni]CAG0892368.1 unnamed protein product [Darwinula stevensoni]